MSTSNRAVQVSNIILHGYVLDGPSAYRESFQRFAPNARRKLGLEALRLVGVAGGKAPRLSSFLVPRSTRAPAGNVAIVLFQRGRESMAAGAVGNEVEVVVPHRLRHGLE